MNDRYRQSLGVFPERVNKMKLLRKNRRILRQGWMSTRREKNPARPCGGISYHPVSCYSVEVGEWTIPCEWRRTGLVLLSLERSRGCGCRGEGVDLESGYDHALLQGLPMEEIPAVVKRRGSRPMLRDPHGSAAAGLIPRRAAGPSGRAALAPDGWSASWRSSSSTFPAYCRRAA